MTVTAQADHKFSILGIYTIVLRKEYHEISVWGGRYMMFYVTNH